jgi:hypothetical protein
MSPFTIYRITFFCDDTYSYSGISKDSDMFFSSLSKAVSYALSRNLRMVESVHNTSNEVILEEIIVE